MEIVNIYKDADAWFQAAESVQSTDELLELITGAFNYAPMEKDFEENTDIMSFLIALTHELVQQKKITQLIDLEQLAIKKQSHFYNSKLFPYLITELLPYYLFFQEEEKAKATFMPFVENPNKGINLFLPALNDIAFYGKNEWISEINAKTYQAIKEYDKYIGEPAQEVAHFHYFSSLQKVFETENIQSEEDLDEWADSLAQYDLEVDIDIYGVIANILATPWEELKIQGKEKANDGLWINMAFVKYMYETKNMSFVTANAIYGLFLGFWKTKEENRTTKKISFDYGIDFERMDKHFSSTVGFLNQYKNKGIAYIWSIPYVYDFLFSLDLINAKLHQTSIDVGKKGRSFILNKNGASWTAGFIKYWEKADSIGQEEQDEAIEKINASFETVYTKDYSKKEENSWKNLIETITSKQFSPQSNPKPKPELKSIPVRTDVKIGRNDPCTCGSGKKYKKCCG
jgi:hypothetical protein